MSERQTPKTYKELLKIESMVCECDHPALDHSLLYALGSSGAIGGLECHEYDCDCKSLQPIPYYRQDTF